jgi:hypothetical protein
MGTLATQAVGRTRRHRGCCQLAICRTKNSGDVVLLARKIDDLEQRVTILEEEPPVAG